MTPITIGLPSGDGRNIAHNAMQEWLCSLGVNVYYPQARYTNSYNIAQQWDAEKEQLNWLPVAVDEAKRFDKPMVGYYPQYFWRDRIAGQKSPNPNAFAFAGISQDKLQAAELAYYLRAVRNWLQARGVAQPWYMIDEPAHPVDGDPHKYGWSATMEARVIKFVTALVDAGWEVGVCHPNYQAHTYWRDRLPAQRVILNAESRRADYGDIMDEVWLYNKRGSFDGLADRMREFGAVGYLHWSATWDKLPLAKMDGTAWEPTAHMAELLRQIELYEQKPQPEPKGGVYQIFLTNAAEHFQAAKGLATIPGWAKRAELQIEFAVTETDRTGARFAPVGSPGRWLESKGVEVWYYVNPVAPVLLATQTRILNEENPQESPFWWRVRQANAIIGNDWILRDAAGQAVIGSGRARAAADIGNPAYIAWLSDEIIKTGVKRVRLDDYNVHQHAFHRPQRASWQDGRDSAAIVGMQTLCDNLRDAGIRVAANGAWEMSNPDANPDFWQYPMMSHVDGVMIELLHKPAEGKANTGFARWSDGKFWTMDALALANVIEHWQQAGADVTLAVTWRGGPEKYEDFARRWHDDAMMGGYWLFTGDDVTHKATHQVDTFPLPVAEPEPPGNGNTPLALIMAEIQAGRGQLHAIEADVLALRERLAIIEQLAAGAL